jgi:hypothetical protein
VYFWVIHITEAYSKDLDYKPMCKGRTLPALRRDLKEPSEPLGNKVLRKIYGLTRQLLKREVKGLGLQIEEVCSKDW